MTYFTSLAHIRRSSGQILLLALGLAAPQQALAASPEAAVVYDLATGKASSPTTKPAPVPTGASSAGSGALAEDALFSPAELEAKSKKEPQYAPYEEEKFRKDKEGNFSPSSVIGADDREVVADTTARPSRAVVDIEFKKTTAPGLWGCSGALVARDVVLTAGHCVFSKGAWHKDFLVYAGRNKVAKPFGECRAKQIYTLDGWVGGGTVDARLYDLAAIRLDCKIGDQTGWFAMSVADIPIDKASGRWPAPGKDPTADWRTEVYGYPCDKIPAGGQWRSRDNFQAATSLKVFYRNDTWGCMSGGPVFLNDDRATVYAVHTNGLHDSSDDWGKNNAGTRLTKVRIDGLLAWIGN